MNENPYHKWKKKKKSESMRLSGAVPTNPPSLYRIRLWILDLPPSLRSSHRTIIAHQPGYRVPASIALKLHLGAKPPLEQLQGFYRHGEFQLWTFCTVGRETLGLSVASTTYQLRDLLNSRLKDLTVMKFLHIQKYNNIWRAWFALRHLRFLWSLFRRTASIPK